MPIRPCPHCERISPRLLEAVSDGTFALSYRCDSCGCVWNIPRDRPDAEPRIVVQGKTAPTRSQK